MQHCKICGAELPDGSTVCPVCGAPQQRRAGLQHAGAALGGTQTSAPGPEQPANPPAAALPDAAANLPQPQGESGRISRLAALFADSADAAPAREQPAQTQAAPQAAKPQDEPQTGGLLETQRAPQSGDVSEPKRAHPEAEKADRAAEAARKKEQRRLEKEAKQAEKRAMQQAKQEERRKAKESKTAQRGEDTLLPATGPGKGGVLLVALLTVTAIVAAVVLLVVPVLQQREQAQQDETEAYLTYLVGEWLSTPFTYRDEGASFPSREVLTLSADYSFRSAVYTSPSDRDDFDPTSWTLESELNGSFVLEPDTASIRLYFQQEDGSTLVYRRFIRELGADKLILREYYDQQMTTFFDVEFAPAA